MRKLALLALPVLLAGHPAFASSSSGSGALALAALVGVRSPALTLRERKALANMLDGRLAFPWPPNRKITVTADKVTCRASNVDISTHSCEIAFGSRTRRLAGRAAHELYATLAEDGVSSEGAAGSIYESVTQLSCTIDVGVVKQRGGGGADCTFTPGQ
jgi:hypothetical protein